MKEDLTIVGGGIAGLTAAIALRQIGIDTGIFESAVEIKAIGAGLGLGANAIRAFGKLGFKEEIIKLGRLLPAFTIYDESGKIITKTDSLASSQKFGEDNFTIHRAELHKFLLSQIDESQVHINKRVTDFIQEKDSVTVKFEDGSEHKTKYLLAADGIHSVFRKKLLPASVPRYAGYTCWRAVVDNSGLNINESSEIWGKGRRFGIVPLSNDKMYWFACINAKQNDKKMNDFRISDLQKHFGNFPSPVSEILKITKDESLIQNDIADIKPVNRFAFGNIVLIGDAAHATTPNLGQGACQAIEDAVILADEINTTGNIKTAFRIFEERRMKRTKYIINTSRRIGKIAQIENGILASFRNYLFRKLPASVSAKQLEKLYNIEF